ncbi:hypothetical protein GUJ93_ZPchr0006g45782 [Zizania palustris]|uniref:Uncharacterized protein n=1 Tax=Zizania palustris TaxID=103762 RepID=A0A8J5SJY4_ZIZPA|nr:hypothetical protein GUJ93_ZPchr0006g45782 [Zizania palustris]
MLSAPRDSGNPRAAGAYARGQLLRLHASRVTRHARPRPVSWATIPSTAASRRRKSDGGFTGVSRRRYTVIFLGLVGSPADDSSGRGGKNEALHLRKFVQIARKHRYCLALIRLNVYNSITDQLYSVDEVMKSVYLWRHKIPVPLIGPCTLSETTCYGQSLQGAVVVRWKCQMPTSQSETSGIIRSLHGGRAYLTLILETQRVVPCAPRTSSSAAAIKPAEFSSLRGTPHAMCRSPVPCDAEEQILACHFASFRLPPGPGPGGRPHLQFSRSSMAQLAQRLSLSLSFSFMHDALISHGSEVTPWNCN